MIKIEKINNRHSIEFEKKAIELYSIYQNLAFVAKDLNTWSTSIRRILLRNNIEIKKNGVGSEHPGWKGGINKNKGDGYIGIWSPNHPRKDGGNYVFEHTLNYEKATGFLPGKNEVLHHIDLDKHNNSIENLYLCNNKKHLQIHRQIEKLIKPLMESGKIIFIDGEYILNDK